MMNPALPPGENARAFWLNRLMKTAEHLGKHLPASEFVDRCKELEKGADIERVAANMQYQFFGTPTDRNRLSR